MQQIEAMRVGKIIIFTSMLCILTFQVCYLQSLVPMSDATIDFKNSSGVCDDSKFHYSSASNKRGLISQILEQAGMIRAASDTDDIRLTVTTTIFPSFEFYEGKVVT